MALRKIYIAVDCNNDTERDAVQALANELSNMRILNADSLLRMGPVFENNRAELTQLFSMITNGGVKSLLSLQGGLLLKRLASKT